MTHTGASIPSFTERLLNVHSDVLLCVCECMCVCLSMCVCMHVCVVCVSTSFMYVCLLSVCLRMFVSILCSGHGCLGLCLFLSSSCQPSSLALSGISQTPPPTCSSCIRPREPHTHCPQHPQGKRMGAHPIGTHPVITCYKGMSDSHILEQHVW